jgi:hypothetical protein
MPKSHSLYLSTLTAGGQYKPVSKTNLANVTWNVNWRDVFSPDDEGKPMKVRVRVLSRNVVAASSGWDTSIGSIRCNLPDKSSNSTNGLFLSLLYWIDNPTTGTGNHIIDVNTLSDYGVESYVPIGTQNFNIQFLDLAETQLASTNVAEYNIIFHFEIDDSKGN